MTKLEEKLEELGYDQAYGLYWAKDWGKATILLKEYFNKITEGKIIKEDCLSDLDIKKASDEMQKDLELLKEYLDEKRFRNFEEMSKLEEKLLELEYRYSFDNSEGYLYVKTHNKKYIFNVLLSYSKRRIENYDVANVYDFHSQKDIDNLQQAFNEFQKDLEILKEIKK